MVALLGALLLVLMGAVGVVGTLSVRSVERDLTVLVDEDGRVLTELHAVSLLVVQAQLAMEQAAGPTEVDLDRQLADFDAAIDEVVREWAAVNESGHTSVPDELLFESWVVAVSRLRAELELGAGPEGLDEARAAFGDLSAAFEDGIVPLAQQVRVTGQDAAARARLARSLLLAVAGIGLGLGALVSRSSHRVVRAQHLAVVRQDAERRREADRVRVEARVTQSLDHVRDDDAALDAGERMLRQLSPNRASELLLADSSRARFEVGLRTDRENGLPGCGVGTPTDCPAVSRGQTLQFPDSEAFDSCPHLHDRPDGPLSAVCVPVSISGIAEGVLHSTGTHGVTANEDELHVLDVVAQRLGERLGVLRTFRRSQLQAATDPLTGLANRRSFENAVAPRVAAGGHLAIAFGDIDHFKRLNDTFGHDTGDRALRTFAQLFRDVVRPDDLVCRWGGEEFVVAFADLDAATAASVLERLRAELAVLSAGGTVPGFTVSFGVADRDDGDTLDGLIHAADRALLTAKRNGRDAVVLASQVPRPSDDDTEARREDATAMRDASVRTTRSAPS